MPSPSNRRNHDPARPPRTRTRQTTEREYRKERGTPEKSHSRTPKGRTQSPERTPKKERTSQQRSGSPERRRRRRSHDGRSRREVVSEKHESYESTNSGSALLSADALAQLNNLNEKHDGNKVKNIPKIDKAHSERRTTKQKIATGRVEKEKAKRRKKSHGHEDRRRISGPLAEEGGVHRRPRGGYVSADERQGKKRFGKKFWIVVAVIVLLLVIFIPVGIVVSKKSSSGGNATGSSNDSGDPSNDNLKNVNENDIPVEAKNTILDPFIWYDTSDFNVTYTKETVGDLHVMGLNSEWDDSTQANDNVPSLDKKWDYGKMPIRGINVGGWLAIEPFITPSLFNSYKSNQAVLDEWTLTKQLGPQSAAQTLEKHYAKFITQQDFKDIQTAGFDHVRIPYSYWAITTYPGDPYVPKISWRYLLRGIEYARQCGLRVNLDFHGLPGSQNGWNHSGKQGSIGWLNGTDGSLNAQRSLDIHTQLSTFFAQPRYKNIITIYGLANEPKMTELSPSTVNDWTTKAAAIVRKSGMTDALIAFGDGFLGLDKWQGQLQGIQGLVLDAHEYVIFDAHQISLSHVDKINYACKGWTGQMSTSLDTSTGFGPTLCGEWSQADTDCAPYLNNVGAGTRWEGTLQGTEKSAAVLKPSCPGGQGCSCAKANAKPEDYEDGYKDWLLMNAEGQMSSFEKGWGWFYWTWRTEGATQWDYRASEFLFDSPIF
ncbi:uncharacterized protein KY384_002713 [Bacidia gigantensis]|uniref:uncharacterized protein n=1 Tax=Bacidia gigantensis TaxID=2732470 RepID=UPI001D047222|nr:uncharacterized protein KY384_002713 [Bacidia gigantensis]KAG8532835.1 hypothetical protein KY384_002713 [Bacidia gigantensis]